jgi:hypothetical protein
MVQHINDSGGYCWLVHDGTLPPTLGAPSPKKIQTEKSPFTSLTFTLPKGEALFQTGRLQRKPYEQSIITSHKQSSDA